MKKTTLHSEMTLCAIGVIVICILSGCQGPPGPPGPQGPQGIQGPPGPAASQTTRMLKGIKIQIRNGSGLRLAIYRTASDWISGTTGPYFDMRGTEYEFPFKNDIAPPADFLIVISKESTFNGELRVIGELTTGEITELIPWKSVSQTTDDSPIYIPFRQ